MQRDKYQLKNLLKSELLKSATKKKKEEPVVPKEPPPEYEFLADPPSISAFDLGENMFFAY